MASRNLGVCFVTIVAALAAATTVLGQNMELGIGLNFVPGIAGLTSQDLTTRTSSPVIITTERDPRGHMRFKLYQRGSTPPFPLTTTSAYLVVSPRLQTISLAPATRPTTPTTDRTRLMLYNGYQKVRVLDMNGTVLTSADLTIPITIFDASRAADDSAIYVLRTHPYWFINRYSLSNGSLTTLPIYVHGNRPTLIARPDGQLHMLIERNNPGIGALYSLDKQTGATTAVKMGFDYGSGINSLDAVYPYIRGGRQYQLYRQGSQINREDIDSAITDEPNGVWGFSVNFEGTRVVYNAPTTEGLSNTNELKSMNIDGSNVVQWTNNRVYDGEPQFLKDGRFLFWSNRLAEDDLWIADANDYSKQKLFYRVGPKQRVNNWTDNWKLQILDP